MVNAIEDKVKELVEIELKSANRRFPLFNSSHEGYAVILEEFEESKFELNQVEKGLNNLWVMVKEDSSEAQKHFLDGMHDRAINLAIEAIQIAAMCEKYEMSLFEKGDIYGN